MKVLNLFILLVGLLSFTSCSHFGGKKSCCKKDKVVKECKDGQCKLDKSCCKKEKKECASCGKSKTACKEKGCKHSGKMSCKDGSCDRKEMKKKSCCSKKKKS